jgi:hypothetical protein
MSTYKKLAAVAAVVAVLALATVGAGLWWQGKQQKVSTEEPVDIVHDFYKLWLTAAQSTTTDPYQEGLADWPFLGEALRAKVLSAHAAGAVDPVLCQSSVPAEIAQRRLAETETWREFLVTARKSTSTEQAIVRLVPLDGGWYVDDIQCSAGEFAPEAEFSFDREGQLVKDSSGNWRLLFVEDGEPGHVAPLIFGAQSACRGQDGAAATCDASLAEHATAHVRGHMTEMGVEVAQLELVK